MMWHDHRYDLPSSGSDPMETVISCALILLMGALCAIGTHLLESFIEWITSKM